MSCVRLLGFCCAGAEDDVQKEVNAKKEAAAKLKAAMKLQAASAAKSMVESETSKTAGGSSSVEAKVSVPGCGEDDAQHARDGRSGRAIRVFGVGCGLQVGEQRRTVVVQSHRPHPSTQTGIMRGRSSPFRNGSWTRDSGQTGAIVLAR